MCVAFWTLDDPEYALILCANRDEYLARPAHPATFHDDFAGLSTVLSGRDVQAGGTWLGVAPSTGRIALLTNITEPPPSPAPPASRGALAPAFLAAPRKTPLANLYPPDAHYAGFNLLVLEAESNEDTIYFPQDSASLVSNGGAGGKIATRVLRVDERVLGGLSNGIHVNQDGSGVGAGEAWPKVSFGRAQFSSAVDAFHHDLEESQLEDDDEAKDMLLTRKLFTLLRTPPAEPPRAKEELRNAICVPPLAIGVGANPRQYYATRTATVLLVRRRGGQAVFVERDVYVWRQDEGGTVELNEGDDGERVFRFRVGVPQKE
ncbi:NRDE protein-domain-containing protein [Mycena amicta]|nr:NRDE protein-domain-containing protein [Mycena amicta]